MSESAPWPRAAVFRDIDYEELKVRLDEFTNIWVVMDTEILGREYRVERALDRDEARKLRDWLTEVLDGEASDD